MNQDKRYNQPKLLISNFQETHRIIGKSALIKEVVNIVKQVASTDITVLITGESGVGKEVIAKAIHATSLRASKPMISVNCAAIPEGLIESELFGHEKGSFTGAHDARKGYFEVADGGTIFLDEIGELPINTQTKFLRVLENGEFMRVGSNMTRKISVRVIAATNKNLEHEVLHKNFRNDLYFRLRSINIHIPPLRERVEDIPLLIEYFTQNYANTNNIHIEGFTDEAIAALKDHPWPGNIRELKNVIESSIVMNQGKIIGFGDIQKFLKEFRHDEIDNVPHVRNLPVHTHKTPEQVERELIYRALLEIKNSVDDIKQFIDNYSDSKTYINDSVEINNTDDDLALDEMEKKYIIKMLKKYHGNRRLAANKLKISERTLYRKINEYGLNDKVY